MQNLGNIANDAVLDFKFNTSTTLVDGAISIYKANSLTPDTTTADLTVDFNSVTGLNHIRIDLTTVPLFFTADSDFDVILSAGTVNGVSVVGTIIAHFNTRSISSEGADEETVENILKLVQTGR